MSNEFKKFLKDVTKWASDFASSRMENEYINGRTEPDFDGLYDDFVMELNDAIIEGIDDGMERWEGQRPLSEQDISDMKADEWYDRQREERA